MCGNSRQCNCCICQGIRELTTSKRFNSPLTHNLFCIKTNQSNNWDQDTYFPVDLKCQKSFFCFCFFFKLWAKPISQIFMVDRPAKPAYTHWGQGNLSLSLVPKCFSLCQICVMRLFLKWFNSELMYIAMFPGPVVLWPPLGAHYANRSLWLHWSRLAKLGVEVSTAGSVSLHTRKCQQMD